LAGHEDVAKSPAKRRDPAFERPKLGTGPAVASQLIIKIADETEVELLGEMLDRGELGMEFGAGRVVGR